MPTEITRPKVKRFRVDHFRERAFCECGGEMVHDAVCPNFHRCIKCGKSETYLDKYPQILYEDYE